MRFRFLVAVLAVAVFVTLAAAADAPAPKTIPGPDVPDAKAPETFKARFETSQGVFVVECTRAWAPHGADRFYTLITRGFFDGVKFFRVVPGFVVQFGIHGDPAVARPWLGARIADDPVKESNKRGYLTFAQASQPNTRSVQLFINLGDNSRLDAQRFAPIGRIVEGMEVVDKLYGGYGEELTSLQGRIAAEGNKFLEASYPKLDAIRSAKILK
jgi:peptidyl-prolyl cis-trans isomerase A (cyclophilin A)